VFGVGRHDLGDVRKVSYDRLKNLFWSQYKIPVALFVKIANRSRHKKKLARVIGKIESHFDINLSAATPKFEWFLRRFIAERIGFRKVLVFEKISHLFMVSADRPSLIAAAHDCGITVIELQHGWMSKTHMRYSWPGQASVSYFPDQFWGWGKFWVDNVPLPTSCITKVMGPSLTLRNYQKQAKVGNSKQVLILSQPFCTHKIIQNTLELATSMRDYKFVLKPHPTEVIPQDALAELCNLENVCVAQPSDQTLDLISESEYCVGVNSTSLFEALSLSKKVLVLPIQGSESLDDLINKGECTKILDCREAKGQFDKARPAANPNYYFDSNADLGALLNGLTLTSTGS
jgi:hypothetical protein